MVDLQLARKVYERGLNLSGGERDWEAYHLAKDVLVLAEQQTYSTRAENQAEARAVEEHQERKHGE